MARFSDAEFLRQDEQKNSGFNLWSNNILTTVYEQQQYVFENGTHSVENRIVSISQPYIRPIVRGKAKSPVEFGAKLDLSVDGDGMCRIEKLSFDAYNESAVLKSAIENYKQRTGHYPEIRYTAIAIISRFAANSESVFQAKAWQT